MLYKEHIFFYEQWHLIPLQRMKNTMFPHTFWRPFLDCTLRLFLDPIDQSHRHGRPQAACREPAGSYDKTTRTAICFEHKTQYLLIHAPYTRIVVFWHISNLPPLFRRVKLVVIPPRFIEQQYLWNIAIQPAVGCYKPWANLRCSGCYPLGEKYCETGLLCVISGSIVGSCDPRS